MLRRDNSSLPGATASTLQVRHAALPARIEDASGVLSEWSISYVKFLIPPPPPPSSPPPPAPAPASADGVREKGGENGEGEKGGERLAEGYYFDEPAENELELVTSRTAIPHQVATMAILGSAGVRWRGPVSIGDGPRVTMDGVAEADGDENGQSESEREGGRLVAWVFLGLDGSLKSLHVEREHRGKGLAKAVCRQIFTKLGQKEGGGMGFRGLEGTGDGEEGGGRGMGEWEGWVHSDVAETNKESAGVARALGGRSGWGVRWVGVDLGVVGEVWGRLVEGEGRRT